MTILAQRVAYLSTWAWALLLVLGGCTQTKTDAQPSASAIASASPPARGLSSSEAATLLARVGDVKITLGDYAAALERMDRYERLRYQSPDRRQMLLDEMVNVELLAQEALRQKLDKSEEFQVRLDEALRDEVLRDLRAQVADPDALEMPEVRAYFESHRSEYREPERRRASAIVLSDAARAQTLVAQARAADPAGFGELVRKFGQGRTPGENTPVELEGDLGIVSAKGESQGLGPSLPDPVLDALFELKQVGDVFEKPVKVGGTYYIVRLTGRTEARDRNFSEAERSIRVRLVDERIEQAEQQLLAKLKSETKITIDDAALARLRLKPAKKEENLRDALHH